ncbi:MAG: hypothetical protein ABID04_03735, partial [Patescibacteria group bacterium]
MTEQNANIPVDRESPSRKVLEVVSPDAIEAAREAAKTQVESWTILDPMLDSMDLLVEQTQEIVDGLEPQTRDKLAEVGRIKGAAGAEAKEASREAKVEGKREKKLKKTRRRAVRQLEGVSPIVQDESREQYQGEVGAVDKRLEDEAKAAGERKRQAEAKKKAARIKGKSVSRIGTVREEFGKKVPHEKAEFRLKALEGAAEKVGEHRRVAETHAAAELALALQIAEGVSEGTLTAEMILDEHGDGLIRKGRLTRARKDR